MSKERDEGLAALFSFERCLSPALVLLNQAINSLNLPNHVGRNAYNLYKRLILKKLTTGRKREGLVGACIYISCLGVNYPVNLEKLCKVLEIEKKELIRQKKFIKRFVVTNEQGITTESYINKYSYQLGLKQEEITQAEKIYKIIEKELINHKSGIKAAVSIYLATRNKPSIRDMARTTGLSRSGIHEAYKKVKHLKPAADLLTSKQSLHIINKKKKD